MAKCDEGYLCDVCGQDVAELKDSDLYLRYVVGLLDPEGRYILQARLSNAAAPPARLYIKVDYLGPAESTLL